MDLLSRALREHYRSTIEVQLQPSFMERILRILAEERRAAFEALPRHRRALVVARRRLRRSWAGRAARRMAEAWGVLLHGLPEPW